MLNKKQKLPSVVNSRSQKQVKLVVIVAGGDCFGSEAKKILQQADLVIAADGGANSCVRLGRVPDFLIGDLDSVKPKILDKLKRNKQTEIIFDPDQNKTDLELAIKILNKMKPKEVIILGVLGNRFDHTLANMITLDKINKKIKFKIIAPDHEIYFVTDKIIITGKPKEIISVVPLTKVTGLTYKGLKWGLENAEFDWGWIGVRNQLVGEKAKITLTSGKILIIKTIK